MAHQLLGYATGELVGRCVEELVRAGIRPRHSAFRSAYAQRADRGR